MDIEQINIAPFLDQDGRIIKMPAKKSVRYAVLLYLFQKFEADKEYTEKEVNAICDKWHSFQDYFLLRRCLIEEGFLKRKNDGSCYWCNDMQNVNQEEKHHG